MIWPTWQSNSSKNAQPYSASIAFELLDVDEDDADLPLIDEDLFDAIEHDRKRGEGGGAVEQHRLERRAAGLHFFAAIFVDAREHGLHALEDLVAIERLDQIVVGADLQTGQTVLHVAAAGDEDDADVRGALDGLEGLADFPAASLRHHDVEQHDVGKARLGEGQCFLAVAREQDLAVQRPEKHPQQKGNFFVIVGNEHDRRGHTLTGDDCGKQAICHPEPGVLTLPAPRSAGREQAMIRFGTSGWRGIIGEDFTFENVRIASQGIANYLKKSGQKGSGVIVAYDTRFLSEKFASEAAKILAFNDIKAFLCTRDVPTPCASFETVRRRAMGAINFTASHNPPEYNGLKFSTLERRAGAPRDHRSRSSARSTPSSRRTSASTSTRKRS